VYGVAPPLNRLHYFGPLTVLMSWLAMDADA
jgi:hypothetical protein